MTGAQDLPAEFAAARSDPGLVVLEGFHALKHAVRFGAVVRLAVAADPTGPAGLAAELAPDLAERLAALLSGVAPEVFARLAPSPPATGVLAIAERPAVDPAAVLADPGPAPVVLLEAPTHHGNVGATVRVAAAATAAGVLSTGPLDPWHPNAVRGAAGLHFAVPVAAIGELAATDRPIVALDPRGARFDRDPVPERAVLAFGSERRGLSPALLARAARRVAIPMRPGVSSLNLATAVAVALYAARPDR